MFRPLWFALPEVRTVAAETRPVALIGQLTALVALLWGALAGLGLLGTHVWQHAYPFDAEDGVVSRPRPQVPELDGSPPTTSVPSGHIGAATALYLGIALVLAAHGSTAVCTTHPTSWQQ